jgi:putative acetyltransferase
MRKINIRFATNEDARGILEAHYSAVHQIASRDYSPEICNSWSAPVTKERVSEYLNNSLPHETTIVAEIAGVITGFAAIVESENELRAVYVAAEFGRRGIGSALLTELERLARAKGCIELHLDSSVTAVAFYLLHDYQVLVHAEHALRAGGVIACVKMRKSLD